MALKFARLVALVAVPFTVSFTVPITPADGGALNPACHTVLSGDTELSSDLDCSGVDGDPLTIGVDGITLRLNGWTLTCPPGFVNSGGETDVEGIRATDRVGVQVLGPGKITGCGRAVTLDGGRDNVVAGLYLNGNLTGILLQGGANPVARGNVIVANQGTGIELSAVVNASVLDNLIAANGVVTDTTRGFGITNDNASSAAISANRIVGNLHGGVAEVGASALTASLMDDIVLGNGGLDLDLRDMDDVVARTICDTSNPPELCPHPLSTFPGSSSSTTTSTTTSTTSTSVPADTDNDGVLDADEPPFCLGTAPDAPVTDKGCSVDQLCSCGAPLGRSAWNGHSEYTACVRGAVHELKALGVVTRKQASEILSAARERSCGKR